MAEAKGINHTSEIVIKDNSMCKVTVYMPAYNYAEYIDKAVQSVLDQTMSDWELIIINDGSTDNTMEVLSKYQNHPR